MWEGHVTSSYTPHDCGSDTRPTGDGGGGGGGVRGGGGERGAVIQCKLHL